VERVVQNASLTLDFAAGAKPGGPVEGKETVYLHLLVVAPDRDRAGALVGLGSNLSATTDAGQALTLRAYSGSEGGLADGKSARVCLLAQDIDVRARQLRTVEGELLVYPHSRTVRLEFPLGRPEKRPLPQTRAAEGLQVTLEEFRLEAGQATAVLSQQWPAGTTVTRPRPEIPFGTVALAGGIPNYPSAERSETLERPNGEQSRRYRLVFPGVKQAPEKITVEALVRCGKPEAVRFRLADIPLHEPERPAAAPAAGQRPAAGAAAPAARGGAPVRVQVRVNGQPAGVGTPSLGLKPGATPNAPWRWLSLPTDAAGTAQVPGLKPGRYRAVLSWTPAPGRAAAAGNGRWFNNQPQFTVISGKPLALPVLEWRGQ
jgi:hypothetical protein